MESTHPASEEPLAASVSEAPSASTELEAPAPVAPTERISSVDVLRGVALLGILTMNVLAFAWPFAGYDNPIHSGGDTLPNRISWAVNHVLFSGKMMTLFSMLFGAGLVLMGDRAEARGVSILGVYYRRIFWLLVIGLIHAYLIWSGDILVWYAACGFLLYPFRKLSASRLLVLGTAILLFSALVFFGFGIGMSFMRNQAQSVLAKEEAGETLTEEEQATLEGWFEMSEMFDPTAEQFEEAIATYRSGYIAIVRHRAPEVLMMHLMFLPILGLWMAGSRMLLGMGLMKLGVFSAQRSTRFYVRMALIGYAIGLPLVILGGWDMWVHDFDQIRAMMAGGTLSYLGTVPVALGHAAVVMLICKYDLVGWLRNRLAAVGRMALTNYLVQSLIGVTLFHGFGLGLFGKVDRPGLWLVVLGIWALQLWYSPRWLSRYRFGPVEWLWRSLTYGKLQPMTRPVEGTGSA